MFLRRTERKKNGKTHHYWNVVENERLDGGRAVQRHVLYLGEINSSQAAAWRKAIEVFDEDTGRSRTLALFPEDRCEAVTAMHLSFSFGCPRCSFVVRANGAPAGWPGSCGRSFSLIGSGPIGCPEPQEDKVGSNPASARDLSADCTGQRMAVHRQWFGNSAMADLLGADFGLAEEHKLYACHDLLLAHKEALFSHLVGRWRDLFNADFDVLLYDPTSTYFEVNASDLPEGTKRRHGYSRDKRPTARKW